VRTAFIEELCAIADANDDVWLVTGDLGYSVLERFAERFPDRYLNVGVAEQNMMGVAAGLALSGKRVVTYSIVNFSVLRCLEQVRNDIAYHDAAVTMVAVGGGFAYGPQGHTHHGLEDISVMRSLGTVDVVAPADAAEARLAVGCLLSRRRPGYIRLERAGEPVIHETPPGFSRGCVIPVREGSVALIAATGTLVAESLAAADILAADGIDCAVWSVPWLNPFDGDAFVKAARRFEVIVTAEEGVLTGGLGAAVAQGLAGLSGNSASLHCAGVGSERHAAVMSQSTARQYFGLAASSLAGKVRDALRRHGPSGQQLSS
jgi:transketolase